MNQPPTSTQTPPHLVAGDNEVSEPVRRFAEVDRIVAAKSVAIAVIVAIASLFFARTYGAAILVAGWLPVGAQLLRLLLRTPTARYRWVIGYNLLVAGCIAIAALATGGSQSPLLMFSVLAGLSAIVACPHQKFWYYLPVLTVAAVLVLDAFVGSSGSGLLMPVTALLVAAGIPVALHDAVNLELTYRRRAVLDPLTGCLNRTSLDARCAELDALAARTGQTVAVIAIDIDHFKLVNDRLGHTVGDQVLQSVAYVIRRHLRRFELFYRTGGEEFVILVPGASLEQGWSLAERLRVAVEAEVGVDQTVTLSAGVVAGTTPDTVEDLLDRADAALMEAKRSGRNRVVCGGADPR